MDLYLLRHADAGDAGVWAGSDDTRPLNAHGRAQADALARHLGGLGLRLDALLSSPLTRALETARPVGTALSIPVTVARALEPGFDLDGLDDLLGDHDGDALMLVGHNPDLERVAHRLSGGARAGFGKGTLMRFRLRKRSTADAELVWLLPSSAYLRS